MGAGGHFCPVARELGARRTEESVVAAQEIEFALDAAQRAACGVRPEVPELFFCADLKGYGWCFRKGDVLNVGLGRLDSGRLSRHVRPSWSGCRPAGASRATAVALARPRLSSL